MGYTSLNLMATSELGPGTLTDPDRRYRAVIRNSGMTWWATRFAYLTAYEAEEAAHARLLELLDDLRHDRPEHVRTEVDGSRLSDEELDSLVERCSLPGAWFHPLVLSLVAEVRTLRRGMGVS